MKEILGEIRKTLTPVYGYRETEGLIRYIFGELCGMSYTDILLKDTKLSPEIILRIDSVVKRLLKKEPIQYIIGYTYFCGIRMKVAPGVLIPRPETAQLANLVIKENCNEGVRMLDICTGSGCIAIALSKGVHGADVSAIDISRLALAIAEENALLCGVSVNFLEMDILNSEAKIVAQYDVIVSNPPYICLSEKCGMDDNVLCYEPLEALFVQDDDSIVFYRRIAEIGRGVLVPEGKLYFEINPRFSSEIVSMLNDNGYYDILVIKDIYGKDRFVRGVK
ncbi:MAG: peptide chain release factor N(5)-glutamine methyltransferase, partial [Bacteroidales bacterium]